MSVSIKVDVSEAVKKLDPAKMEEYLTKAVDGAADLVRADIRTYPPPPPQSTYVRTGILGGSWTKKIERIQYGVRAIIGTDTPYAKWVQNAPTQAWMHRGRWQTVQSVAEKQAQAVKRFIEQALARWAR